MKAPPSTARCARLPARFVARAAVVRALAHPSRLCLLEELQRGERCVQQLTDLVGSDMSTVSKHLALLKAAGLVGDERRGKQIWYHLRCRCVTAFLDCVEVVARSTARRRARK